MSNYEVKCVFSDIFLLKIGKIIIINKKKLAKNAS